MLGGKNNRKVWGTQPTARGRVPASHHRVGGGPAPNLPLFHLKEKCFTKKNTSGRRVDTEKCEKAPAAAIAWFRLHTGHEGDGAPVGARGPQAWEEGSEHVAGPRRRREVARGELGRWGRGGGMAATFCRRGNPAETPHSWATGFRPVGASEAQTGTNTVNNSKTVTLEHPCPQIKRRQGPKTGTIFSALTILHCFSPSFCLRLSLVFQKSTL